MCNLSWTPHSSLEKNNSINDSCVTGSSNGFVMFYSVDDITDKVAQPCRQSSLCAFSPYRSSTSKSLLCSPPVTLTNLRQSLRRDWVTDNRTETF